MLKNFLRKNVAKIHEINQKYSVSRVQMSRAVKYSLLMLRLYLLFLVALLVYKFITIII